MSLEEFTLLATIIITRFDAERVYFMVKGKNELLVNYVDSFMSSHCTYYVLVSLVSYTLRLQLIAGTNFSVFALRVFGIY